MKTQIKKIAFVAIIMGAISLFVFSGCKKDFEDEALISSDKTNIENIVKSVETGSIGSGSSSIQLLAGQNYDAGNVFFSDIDQDMDGRPDALEVSYNTSGGWFLSEVHFWIGNSISDMPQTGAKNPKVGLFPYSFKDLNGVASFSFIIPFSDFGFSCERPSNIYVASHASVYRNIDGGEIQNETAWGAGDKFNEQGSWAMFTPIYIECAGDVKPVSLCQNSFAYGGDAAACFSSFPSIIGSSSGLGWTNGPLKAGSYVFDLYIGSRQCNTEQASVVGSVFVEFSEGIVDVSYVIEDERYSLEKINLYVGNEPFPMVKGSYTSEAGSYPVITNEIPNPRFHQVLLDGFEGEIYVIASATVCGFERRVVLTEIK